MSQDDGNVNAQIIFIYFQRNNPSVQFKKPPNIYRMLKDSALAKIIRKRMDVKKS